MGEWKDDKKNGKGTQYFSNGNKYIGDWVDGNQNGQGYSTWCDGNEYESVYSLMFLWHP